MNIALIQLDMKWQDPAANYVKAERYIRQAAEEGCDLAVLPEAFNTGFPISGPMFRKLRPDTTTSFLSLLARELGINIIAGYFKADSVKDRGSNMAAVFDRKGENTASYSKLYLFSIIDESDLVDAGHSYCVFSIDGVPACLFICYDLRFPEVFRAVAKPVSCIFVVANWPAKRIDHWTVLLRARAIENQCYVVGVNRTGADGNNIVYPGVSLIYDPWGREICRGGDGEGIVTCVIETSTVAETRKKMPFLDDMRPIDIDLT